GEAHAGLTSPAQTLKELNLPAIVVESYSGYALDILPDATQGSWSMRTVGTGDTLETILSEMELSKASQALHQDAAISQALKSLQAGARLFVQVVEDQLEQLIYTKGENKTYVVSITDDGYVGKWETGVFEARHSKATFNVQYSIERDGKNAGLSKSVIRQLSQVFQKDMDFKRDVKVGDNIGVIFEDFRYQGESIYTDKILAAEYSNGKKIYQRIRFTLQDGKVGYFSPASDTELKRTAFDRKPVDGIISSGFGMRRHPIFGLRRNHAGIDIAAPYGTPIRATADGSVGFIGRQSGYGNLVELHHGNGIVTRYGHMSAFKEGLSNGAKVKRGDVIGYVGSTGTSTGNHVHYEYHIDGQPQNPMTVELPKTGVMSDSDMREFRALAAAMTQQLTDLRRVAAFKLSANRGG
ncbi:MAG: M23 family metallopeptidase, partial [Thiothrix sp.]